MQLKTPSNKHKLNLTTIWIRGLKHVKAWLKPNLHKIRKTVITLSGFGIIFAELAV